MSTPNVPHTLLVARAWLELVTPAEVRAVDTLPRIADVAPADLAKLRSHGIIRVTPTGGTPAVENPMRHPTAAAECFVPPAAESSELVPLNRAARLAEWVVLATEDQANVGLLIDFGAVLGPGFAGYAPVRVHTVSALREPGRVPDPSNWARFDVDLHLHWSSAT